MSLHKETQPQDVEEQVAKPETKKEKKNKDAEIVALAAKLEKAQNETLDVKNSLLRTAAEYDNFRKRSIREKDAAFGDGISFAVEKLLSVIDTLELAANAECKDEEYKKGVTMTLSKCAEAFTSLGVEEIQAQDSQFDPEIHAAVMQQESDKESGTVVNVFQKGYKLKDKVIRHATVAVAQ